MKKLIRSLLFPLLVIALSVMIFSCGDDETDGSNGGASGSVSASSPSADEDTGGTSAHEHTYAKAWEKEEQGHYRPCICHPEVKNFSDHMDTVDQNGLCDVCQYEMEKEKVINVIVQDKNGQGVQGAEIKIYTQSVEHTVKTDENGSCSGSFVYTNGLKAMIISLPDEYKRPEKTIFSIYEDSLTITVEKNNE